MGTRAARGLACVAWVDVILAARADTTRCQQLLPVGFRPGRVRSHSSNLCWMKTIKNPQVIGAIMQKIAEEIRDG